MGTLIIKQCFICFLMFLLETAYYVLRLVLRNLLLMFVSLYVGAGQLLEVELNLILGCF